MNYYSQLVKTFSILAALVFLSTKLFAQTPVPIFSARFQFSGQQASDSSAIFSALDEQRGKHYTSESDAKKDIDAAQKFNKELDEKAISIDSGTNALQAIAGKFAALGGLKELRQTILEQQKSKDKYQEDFKHQLKQNTKTRGLFLVVLPNTESQTDWGPPQFRDAAKQVLKARAVKELNKVFINSVTRTIDRNDVEQSIKDSVAGFMDFEEIPYEWRRAFKRDYIMLVYLNVTPLSGSTTQTMGTSSISLAPLHLINCENDDDVNSLIISMGLPLTEAATLQTRISEYKNRLKKANSDAEIGIRSMWNALNSNLQNLTATIESARKEERHKSQQLKDMITQMYPDGIRGITLLDSIGAIQKKLEERSAEIAESKRINESSRLYLKENVRFELNENSPREVIAEALLNAAKDMNVNYGNKTIYTEQILLVDKKVKDAKINGYIFKRGMLKNVWANIYISPDEKYYLNMIATFDIDKQTKFPSTESDSIITDQAVNINDIVIIGNSSIIAKNWKLAFDKIYWEKENEGLIPVEKNDFFGYVDTTGKLIIPLKYRSAAKFESGLGRVSDGSTYGFINKYDELIIPFRFINAGDFSLGLAWVYNGFRYGYIDNSGNLIFNYKFDYADDFRDTRGPYGPVAMVGNIAGGGNKKNYGIIDRLGNIILECAYDHIQFEMLYGLSYGNTTYSSSGLGCAIVAINGRVGLRTFIEKGFKLDINYRNIIVSDNGHHIAVQYFNDAKWRVFTNTGELFNDLIFDNLTTTGDMGDDPCLSFIVTVNGKMGILGGSGHRLRYILKPEYDYINNFIKYNYAIVWQNKKQGLLKLEENGSINVITPIEYDELNFIEYWDFNKKRRVCYENDLIRAKKNGKWGYIDEQGKTIVEIKYDWLFPIRDSLVFVEINEKWGVINLKGEIITDDFKYDSIRQFSEGLAFVKQNDEWGVIDKQGRVVLAFQYDDVGHNGFKDGKAEVRKNGKAYFIDYYGKPIIND